MNHDSSNDTANNIFLQFFIDRLNSYQSHVNYLPIIGQSIDHIKYNHNEQQQQQNVSSSSSPSSAISTERIILDQIVRDMETQSGGPLFNNNFITTVFPSTLNYSSIVSSSSTVVKQLIYDNNNNQDVAVSMASTPPTTEPIWDPDLVADPLWTTIPMTILYVLILVTGVIGNVLTCVVIARNRYMHTATNYYLFSLAISDLLLLVLGLPQEIYQIWYRYPYVFGEAFCILRGFSSEASTNSSVLTITAFTMERYIAICHPLRAHTMSKLSRAIKLIVIIWMLGFLCAAPIAYQFGIVFDYLNGQIPIQQSAACNIKRPVPYLEEHIFALSSLIVFVLPVTWITVLYILIGIKLRQSSKNANPDMARLRRRPIKRLRAVSLSKRFIHLASAADAATATTTADNISIEIDQSSNKEQAKECKKNSNKFKQGKCRPMPLIKDMNESMSSSSSNQPNAGDETTKGSEVIKCYSHVQQSFLSSSTPSSPLVITPTTIGQPNKSLRRQKIAKFKSSSTISNSSTSSSNSLAQRRAVIKMLTAVVVAFFICFAPFHAQRLMAIYVKNPSDYETIAFTLLTYISGVTYYLSATINPILYSIMSVRFRQAFHDTFVRTFCPSVFNQFDHRGTTRQMYCSTYSHHHQQQHMSSGKLMNVREKTIINRHDQSITGKQTATTTTIPKNGMTQIDEHCSADNKNIYRTNENENG
ncbi:G-protein coupled receptor [Dermatophagoides farinae]|uniref:G-protein coupled receptor n=1 Tax=Dermatophagoides farinae TaxID=6954 RepID=A0A922HT29_DERFA|nr:G-protein coupled receptor [Dermatophagoides farinae]